uniref:Uncharacterized protein n=1 Tax=Anopheles culicifacies TaxID=139723 RepID=A0A182M084_9DIPT
METNQPASSRPELASKLASSSMHSPSSAIDTVQLVLVRSGQQLKLLAHIGRQHSAYTRESTGKDAKSEHSAGKRAPGTRGLRCTLRARYNQAASQITSQKVRLIRVLALAPTVSKNEQKGFVIVFNLLNAMYSKDRHLVWVLLVTAGHLLVRVCNATEHIAGPSGRMLNHGALGAIHHNHLMLQSDGLVESTKFASPNSVPHVPYAVPAAWRISATVSTPLASSWNVRKPLAKPLRSAGGGSRSRINNRSMTRFSEVEIPPGLEQQLDVPELQRPEVGDETGLVELYRSAERSRGIENLFWKYFVDSGKLRN